MSVKIFISWSGSLSKNVAEHLKHWLECVIQSIIIWTSYEDIDKGA
jgi:hypothetical protein